MDFHFCSRCGHPVPPPAEPTLAEIKGLLLAIYYREGKMQTDLTQLQADVAAETTADQSAITLLQGLKAALDAAGTDPVALKVLSDQIEQNTAALAAAVTANTPAPPASASTSTDPEPGQGSTDPAASGDPSTGS